MTQLLRFFVISGTTAICWFLWVIDPKIFDAMTVVFLLSIFSIVWGTAFHFYGKTRDASRVYCVTAREQQKLNDKLKNVRDRVWWIGLVILVSSTAGFLVLRLVASNTALRPICLGILVGIGASYIITIRRWMDELSGFEAKMRLREQNTLRTNSILKEIEQTRGRGSSC